MKINLIWAQDKNRGIGLGGKMPWHLPEDLAHFKRLTRGCPIIMGRKTWQSLPKRPLPERKNIVLSQSVQTAPSASNEAVTWAENLHTALACAALDHKASAVWVIGGAQIYELFLPYAQEIVITDIRAEFIADTFAPALNAMEWQEFERIAQTAASGLHFDFVTFKRMASDERTLLQPASH